MPNTAPSVGLKKNVVPKDSVLHQWIKALSITELPISYQIVCGLSAIGACLKRNVWVDQVKWRVYPNLSVLLIGPSGIGKDIAIDQATLIVELAGTIPVVVGRTIEYLKSQLLELEDPAACFTPVGELTAFLGGKDYQRSMVQELTDLLTTGRKCDVSTKGEGRKIILNPTITIQAGSTEAWLYKAMPDGSLEGGFLPRFLIVCEDYPSRHIPWIEFDTDVRARQAATKAGDEFLKVVGRLVQRAAKRPQGMIPSDKARDFYRNWYCNRFKYFSTIVRPYANRSRDHMHRLAMLMAVTRECDMIDEVDYQFAANIMTYVANSIDKTIAPFLRRNDRR